MEVNRKRGIPWKTHFPKVKKVYFFEKKIPGMKKCSTVNLFTTRWICRKSVTATNEQVADCGETLSLITPLLGQDRRQGSGENPEQTPHYSLLEAVSTDFEKQWSFSASFHLSASVRIHTDLKAIKNLVKNHSTEPNYRTVIADCSEEQMIHNQRNHIPILKK